MKYLSPDVSVMKCPGKVLYKENIILELPIVLTGLMHEDHNIHKVPFIQSVPILCFPPVCLIIQNYPQYYQYRKYNPCNIQKDSFPFLPGNEL